MLYCAHETVNILIRKQIGSMEFEDEETLTLTEIKRKAKVAIIVSDPAIVQNRMQTAKFDKEDPLIGKSRSLKREIDKRNNTTPESKKLIGELRALGAKINYLQCSSDYERIITDFAWSSKYFGLTIDNYTHKEGYKRILGVTLSSTSRFQDPRMDVIKETDQLVKDVNALNKIVKLIKNFSVEDLPIVITP